MERVTVVEVRALVKEFRLPSAASGGASVRAVDDVTLRMVKGRTLGLDRTDFGADRAVEFTVVSVAP